MNKKLKQRRKKIGNRAKVQNELLKQMKLMGKYLSLKLLIKMI